MSELWVLDRRSGAGCRTVMDSGSRTYPQTFNQNIFKEISDGTGFMLGR